MFRRSNTTSPATAVLSSVPAHSGRERPSGGTSRGIGDTRCGQFCAPLAAVERRAIPAGESCRPRTLDEFGRRAWRVFSRPGTVKGSDAMVDISIAEGKACFEVEGLDKLWSLKSRLEIPLAHIRGVRNTLPSHAVGGTDSRRQVPTCPESCLPERSTSTGNASSGMCTTRNIWQSNSPDERTVALWFRGLCRLCGDQLGVAVCVTDDGDIDDLASA
jgi:hypothetical protein